MMEKITDKEVLKILKKEYKDIGITDEEIKKVMLCDKEFVEAVKIVLGTSRKLRAKFKKNDILPYPKGQGILRR